MKTLSKKNPWTIFLVIILAFVIGNLTGKDSSFFGVTFYSLYDIIGTLFINALTMLVVPLVVSSIILGVSRIGDGTSPGRLSAKILGFYLLTTLSAVLIGLLFVNVLEPGNNTSLRLSIQSTQEPIVQMAGENASPFSSLLLSIIPSNIFRALAGGDMLSLIFFSLLFGFALSKTSSGRAGTLFGFFSGLFEVMIGITQIIMKTLPLGVFCLVAKVAATTGYHSLSSLVLFFCTVVGGLFFFGFVVLPLFLRFIGKVSPKAFFRVMSPALITAFSTSSSAATLPITMDCLEKKGGLSNRICSLVVPLGTSLNMSGSALYECTAAMFIAQVYGVAFSFGSQVIFVLMALLTSMGVVGIPGASLIAVMVILKAFNLPIEGIGLFLAVDRVLDMCRTTINVLSDSCCAVLVAKTEGEETLLNKTKR